MSEDEELRLIVFLSDYQSMRETWIWQIDLACADAAAAMQKLAAMMSDIDRDIDNQFRSISEAYDEGWDILRDAETS